MDMYALIALGGGILVWATVIFKNRYSLYKKSERIKGKIKEFRKIDEVILETLNYSEKVTTYKPIIEIEYKENKKIFYYDMEIDRKIYGIGDEIDIIYDVEKDTIFIDSPMEFLRFPIFLYMISILFFSFSLMMYLFR
ncbi:MAG: hypothetical protein ACRC28_02975 [Clostridium sp.]|uniref:hypothetical protein n=1 Tax=Clostridium sp. TaxID=1506 RepID=UPI003F381E25